MLKEYQKNNKGLLLDVRTKDEYANGHIPNSINIPLDQIDQYQKNKDKVLYVYCQSGARSEQAVAILKANGYHAENIGGILDYHGEIEG